MIALSNNLRCSIESEVAFFTKEITDLNTVLSEDDPVGRTFLNSVSCDSTLN